MKPKQWAKIKGFSLIELLLSMLFAAMIMTGLIAAATAISANDAAQESIADVNARLEIAEQIIRRQLRQAAFINDAYLLQAPMPFNEVDGFEQGAAVYIAEDSFMAQSQILHLRYQGSESSNFYDCNGHSVAANELVWIRMYVDHRGSLRCKRNSRPAYELLEDMADLKFLAYAKQGDSMIAKAFDSIDVGEWQRVSALEVSVAAISEVMEVDSSERILAFSGVRDQRLGQSFMLSREFFQAFAK